MKRFVKLLLGRLSLLLSSCGEEYRRSRGEEEIISVPAFCAKIGCDSVIESTGGIVNMTGDEKQIFIGENSQIAGRLLCYPTGGQITVGDWCYIGQRSEIWSMKEVFIGNRVFMSHDVNVHDTNSHSLNAKERHEHFRYFQAHGSPSDWSDLPGVESAAIRIEDDCWLGFGVTVFKGVTIGRGSVIAARSVVTKDVPPNSFYRCRFDPVIEPLTS